MIPEKKDLPGAKSGRPFFLFCIVLMPLSLSRGEEATRRRNCPIRKLDFEFRNNGWFAGDDSDWEYYIDQIK